MSDRTFSYLGSRRHTLGPVAKTNQPHCTNQSVFLCDLTGQSHLEVLHTVSVHQLWGQETRRQLSEGFVLIICFFAQLNVAFTHVSHRLPGAEAEPPDLVLVQLLDAERQMGRDEPAAQTQLPQSSSGYVDITKPVWRCNVGENIDWLVKTCLTTTTLLGR